MSETNREIIVVPWHPFGRKDVRFRIIDPKTREIIDDAGGYGYRSKKGAYKSYYWKAK